MLFAKERSVLAEIGDITEKDILIAILMMNDNSSPSLEEPANARLVQACFLQTPVAEFDSASSSDTKIPTNWNYSNFIKVFSEQRKINWQQVLKHIDCPEFYLSSRKAFLEFVSVCDILRDNHKATFPRELFIGKWENTRGQVNFMEKFLELGQADLSIYREMKNKNMIEYDSNPSVKNSAPFINSGMEVWLNKDLITRLIELSDSKYYLQIRALFDMPMRKYPEIILASLSQVNPRCGNILLEDIFSSSFPEILDNVTTYNKIIGTFFFLTQNILVETTLIYLREH